MTGNPLHVHIGIGRLGLGLIVPATQKAGFDVSLIGRRESPSDERIRAIGDVGSYKLRYTTFVKEHTQVITAGSFSIRVDYADSYSQSGQLPRIFPSKETMEAAGFVLITTSVGISNLPEVAPVVCQILKQISQCNGGSQYAFLIACENGKSASSALKAHTVNHISKHFGDYASDLNDFIESNTFFLDSVVDRIVPSSPNTNGDGLFVNVESAGTWWITEPGNEAASKSLKSALISSENCIVKFIAPQEYDFIERRKAWAMNGIHLAVGALSYEHEITTGARTRFLAQGLQVPHIQEVTALAMGEIKLALELTRPDSVEESDVSDYCNNVLSRIETTPDEVIRALGDFRRLSRTYGEMDATLDVLWDGLLTTSIRKFVDGPAKKRFLATMTSFVQKIYISPMIDKLVCRVSDPLRELSRAAITNDPRVDSPPVALPFVLTTVLSVLGEIAHAHSQLSVEVLSESLTR